MKKLLLTSAGFENPEIGEEFLKLVDKPTSEIKVIIIPTAARKEGMIYVEKSKNELLDVGIDNQNIKTLDLDHRISYNEVKNFDVIYVCGGNTFYLLDKVKETGFDKIIKQFIEKGNVYVGVSAGSYIVCPTIEMAAWKPRDRNDIGLKDLTALDLVPFLITAHFNPKYEEIIRREKSRSKYAVKILTDNQALLILDNKIKIVGN